MPHQRACSVMWMCLGVVMREYFSSLCRYLNSQISLEENWLAWMEGEKTEYCRFNRGLIRQCGELDKNTLTLTLTKNHKQTTAIQTLTMIPAEDRDALGRLLRVMRTNLKSTPEDENYQWCDQPACSRLSTVPGGFCGRAVTRDILETVSGTDMVGKLLSGWIYRAFGSSQGHHHWFESHSFSVDYSVFVSADKGVKDQYTGTEWDKEYFRQRFALVKERAELLKQPAKDISGGEYRVYLAPFALHSIFSRIDFSARMYHENNSWLNGFYSGKPLFNPGVSLNYRTDTGLVPAFQKQGYIRPTNTLLIENGVGKQLIAGPKTAEKYSVPFNGGEERSILGLVDPPDYMEMKPGTLAQQDICNQLGDGLYISNLWYLNWSEKSQARMTGMTRYACFEVRNGQLAQPINPVRFDDSLLSILGDKLEALTAERDTLSDAYSFYQRNPGGFVLPGALIDGMTFTF